MEDKILEILKNVLELDEVDQMISQFTCDKWDSLHHLNLVVELESVFEVEFEPEEIAKMKDFSIIVKVLSEKINNFI